MEPSDRSDPESTLSPESEQVTAFPSFSTFHGGPRRQGFAPPHKAGAPLTPGRPSSKAGEALVWAGSARSIFEVRLFSA
jgi:hypothetical protein